MSIGAAVHMRGGSTIAALEPAKPKAPETADDKKLLCITLFPQYHHMNANDPSPCLSKSGVYNSGGMVEEEGSRYTRSPSMGSTIFQVNSTNFYIL
jgi:hypothetical protein